MISDPEIVFPIAADGVEGFKSWLASATGAWIEATATSLKGRVEVEAVVPVGFEGVEVQLT